MGSGFNSEDYSLMSNYKLALIRLRALHQSECVYVCHGSSNIERVRESVIMALQMNAFTGIFNIAGKLHFRDGGERGREEGKCFYSVLYPKLSGADM